MPLAQEKPLNLRTVYGTLTVAHPLLIELIESPAFQRLKGINQYGVVNFIKATESYSRLDHSLGVLWLLQKANAPLAEQVAGLLHDVSHTAFSHVGDFVFHDNSRKGSYQDEIHTWYISESGLGDILAKYGLSAEETHPSNPLFKALEQPLPDLCADRLDYNLQGGLLRGLLSTEELKLIVEDLHFKNGVWSLSSLPLAKALGKASLTMTETLWGAPWEGLAYRWTADALLRSFEIGLISHEEFHFTSDQHIWDKLKSSRDPSIKEKLHALSNVDACFSLAKMGEEDLVLKLKFRGLNPLLRTESHSFYPLTSLDANFSAEYTHLKDLMEIGWPITYKLQKNANV